MSNLSSLPISEVIKKGKELERLKAESADAEPQVKRSRSEAYKREKELEEARKAGDAPALVDEEGRDINPHIPQYISSVPFFYNTSHPTLKHQRSLKQGERPPPPAASSGSSFHQRGIKYQASTKWRKGACENCGAMDHRRKDCLERPRKVGARFTNKDIAPSVLLPAPDEEEHHNYESKRDRWAGYHPGLHKQTIEEYERVEEAKRRLKEQRLKEEAAASSSKRANESDDSDDEDAATAADCDTTNKPATARERGDVELDDSLSDDSDEDDEKYADKADMPGTKVDSKQRITVRNLRIREDTAKYLLNLDPNSAYYDPKTRSMRENPLPTVAASTSSTQAGLPTDDNFVRYSGDVDNYNKARRFAWEASEKGVDVHLEALPTKTAMIQREFETKKQEHGERQTRYIEETYGPNLARPASELQVSQSERYAEFSRTGRVLCGPARPTPSIASATGAAIDIAAQEEEEEEELGDDPHRETPSSSSPAPH